MGTAVALIIGSWWQMCKLEIASLNVADAVINMLLLEGKPESQACDESRLLELTIAALKDDNETEEFSPRVPQMRKVMIVEHDRQGAAHQGVAGMLHSVRAHDPVVAPPCCTWSASTTRRSRPLLGRRAAAGGSDARPTSKWRLVDEDEDVLPFAGCDRCAGSSSTG